MKKALVVSFKILLPLFFLYNIGLFSLNFSAIFKDTGKNAPLNQQNNNELIRYVNGKIRIAEKKGDAYGPYDYFRDLHEIQKFEKSLPGTMGYQNAIYPLMSLHSNNLSHRYFSSEDVSKAREYYDELENPGITLKNKLETERFKKTWWPNLSAWLIRAYLKNFLIAFLLLLFWWYQEKKNLKVSNPLSFMISLIFYPITIALVIKEALTEEGRYYYAEAELRRTKKKMFSMLSANEVDDLKRFAKSRGISLKEWKTYLQNQGLETQHLLAPSLIVTLLFISIPRVTYSQKTPLASVTGISVVSMINIHADSSPTKNCPAKKISSTTNAFGLDLSFVETAYEFCKTNSVQTLLIAWIKRIRPQEVLRKIDHVPCFSF